MALGGGFSGAFFMSIGGDIMSTENTMTPEQIEVLLEQAAGERERLAQENLPRWYQSE